jgi:hypothetical protein
MTQRHRAVMSGGFVAVIAGPRRSGIGGVPTDMLLRTPHSSRETGDRRHPASGDRGCVKTLIILIA